MNTKLKALYFDLLNDYRLQFGFHLNLFDNIKSSYLKISFDQSYITISTNDNVKFKITVHYQKNWNYKKNMQIKIPDYVDYKTIMPIVGRLVRNFKTLNILSKNEVDVNQLIKPIQTIELF